MIKLKELRQEKGFTQTYIAEKFSISRQVYANYENEINQPSIETLIALADFFGCSVDYLVGREDEDGRIISAVPQLPADAQELLDNYQQLNPAAQLLVRGYAKGMLSAPYITKKSN